MCKFYIIYISKYFNRFEFPHLQSQGPESTKIEVNIIRLDLPYSTQGVCYHFVEVRDYLSGSTGKL